MKRIKKSNRGLTFSLNRDEATIGSKYRYIIDKANGQINIIFDPSGKLKVSKKKTGTAIKPLFDLRSKEVRKVVSEADYLEIEINDNSIIVYTRKVKKTHIHRKKLISIDELLGKRTGKIVIPESMKLAAGCEGQMDLSELFPDCFSAFTASECEEVSKDRKRIYNIVSLFSGAGLFDKSWLDDGRFRFIYANDFSKEVEATYRYNIGDHIVIKDIREIDRSEIPVSDVTIGGPCCQAYSNCNRHNIASAEAEEKRLLIDDYARLVKSNVWVIENVPTILTKQQGYYFDRLCSQLSDYEITATIITDCEVGGYSKRQRAIIIGSKIGKIELPKLKVITPKTVRDALANVDASWFNWHDVTIPSEATAKKMSFVPQGGNWRNIPPEYNSYGPNTQSNIMRRLSWNAPAITLSNFRKSNILHPEENRTLNVSEAAAIMGLKKEFHFFGNLAAKQQMVANGVTQAIGKVVKNAVLSALDNYYRLACSN